MGMADYKRNCQNRIIGEFLKTSTIKKKLLTNYLSILQIVWENRFVNAKNLTDTCFISLDGTNFAIQEPRRPIDPRYFSHKLNQAAVRYKVGIAIQTG